MVVLVSFLFNNFRYYSLSHISYSHRYISVDINKRPPILCIFLFPPVWGVHHVQLTAVGWGCCHVGMESWYLAPADGQVPGSVHAPYLSWGKIEVLWKFIINLLLSRRWPLTEHWEQWLLPRLLHCLSQEFWSCQMTKWSTCIQQILFTVKKTPSIKSTVRVSQASLYLWSSCWTLHMLGTGKEIFTSR